MVDATDMESVTKDWVPHRTNAQQEAPDTVIALSYKATTMRGNRKERAQVSAVQHRIFLTPAFSGLE